jgi:2,4-dienoyl-CoA reductase-like NADH-dependent reductase (Old Yellow Enzyme family)
MPSEYSHIQNRDKQVKDDMFDKLKEEAGDGYGLLITALIYFHSSQN